MTFTNYIFLPMGIWLLIYCFYDRAKDSRYGIHHKSLSACKQQSELAHTALIRLDGSKSLKTLQ